MRYNVFIISLLLLPLAFALTASPAVHITPYHQGTEQYTITITNDEQRTLTIIITPTGPLSKLIQTQSEITLASGEQKTIPVTVRMPDSTQPGIIESGILFEGKPVSAGTIAATTAVMHVIRVETPKQGSFLAGELLISAGIINTPVMLTVSITNTGTETLNTVIGTIRIANQLVTLPIVSIAPGETKNLVTSWTPTKIGSYDATASIQYADKQATFSTNIIVGNLSIKLLGIEPGEFRLGDPFRILVIAKNEWGNQLPAATKLTISQNNTVVTTGTSTAVTIQPLEQAAIPVFLESSDLQLGNATLGVQIIYADKTATATYPLFISVDSIAVLQQQSAKPQDQGLVVIAVIITILLIVIIASRIFIKKRRLPKR